MRYVVVTLLRNLGAGVRVALFRPVAATAFRFTLGALVALVAFGYALDIALDALHFGAGATFNLDALPGAAFDTSVTLLVVASLTMAFRQRHLMLAMLVVLLAARPVIEIAGAAYRWWGTTTVNWTPALTWIGWGAWFVLIAWVGAVAARAFALTLWPRPRHFRTAVAATVTVMVGVGYLVDTRFAREDWWRPPQVAESPSADRWNVVTEQALVRQPQLLAEALRAIEPQRPGTTDLYFVAFAPHASQDVFAKDVAAARAVVNERFGVANRSVALISNPRTVLEAPIATASNLRATLKALGERIDVEDDIVMLFLTSHGSKDHRLSVEFFPLRLDGITAADVKSMLDDAGIRWRIVVISACYAGGFIPALADERTLVMTAAASDRTSFGCSHDSEMTFFTDALFNQALRTEPTLVAAFERARVLVAERERAEGLVPPSDPQISIGALISDKLQVIEPRSSSPLSAARVR